MSFDVGLREQIRKFRTNRGMSTDDLAAALRRLGVAWDRSTLTAVERGKRTVKASELFPLSWAFNVTLDELLDFDWRPAPPVDRPDEPTCRTALRLGVTPEVVMEASHQLWGRGFMEERDARVRSAHPDASAAERRAYRGRVTRDLEADLRQACHTSPVVL